MAGPFGTKVVGGAINAGTEEFAACGTDFLSSIALSIASGSIVRSAKPARLANQRAEMPSRCSLGFRIAFTRTSTGAQRVIVGANNVRSAAARVSRLKSSKY